MDSLRVVVCVVVGFAGFAWAGDAAMFDEAQTSGDAMAPSAMGYGDDYAMAMDEMASSYGKPMVRRTTSRHSRRVVVVPVEQMAPKKLASTVEEMLVMSHIVERTIQAASIPPVARSSMFEDFGAYFTDTEVASQSVYIEGHGALFLITVDFPLSAPAQAAEAETEKADEPVDKTWEQAKQRMLSPRSHGRGRRPDTSGDYDAERIDNLKSQLTKMLKHASNMQNVGDGESVIITLNSQSVSHSVSQQFMMMYSPDGGGGGFGMGGSGSFGGSYGMGGGAGYGGGASGGYRMGGPMGAPRPKPRDENAPKPVSVMTIRAKKSDIDAFAAGKIDAAGFAKKVRIIAY